MASATPAAPSHLPEKIQKKWIDAYEKALEQAKVNYPDSEREQRTVATKEANRLLAVPAPKSAADIDKLDDWQVLIRGTRAGKGGGQEAYAVTSDGRKYTFPIEAKPARGNAKKAEGAPAEGSGDQTPAGDNTPQQ